MKSATPFMRQSECSKALKKGNGMTYLSKNTPSIFTRIRTAALVGAATLTMVAANAGTVFAAGTLRIGMTASDIPLTTGQTDQGGEGQRFMGYTVYDSLIELGPVERRQAFGADARPRGLLGCRCDRQDEMDLQAARWREVS
jgi:hypothetical protein